MPVSNTHKIILTLLAVFFAFGSTLGTRYSCSPKSSIATKEFDQLSTCCDQSNVSSIVEVFSLKECNTLTCMYGGCESGWGFDVYFVRLQNGHEQDWSMLRPLEQSYNIVMSTLADTKLLAFSVNSNVPVQNHCAPGTYLIRSTILLI